MRLPPVDSARIRAIPIMPMDPAKEVRRVLAFLVFRLLKLSESAVRKDMEAFPIFLCSAGSSVVSSTVNGSESERMVPSLSRTIGWHKLCQFGVVSNHDHQPVFCHLF